MELHKYNIQGKASEAFVRAVDNKVHIICSPQNEGQCPSTDPLRAITEIQKKIDGDSGKLEQRQWFIYKGDGVSELRFRTDASGTVREMYVGNKLLSNFPITTDIDAKVTDRDDINRYATMSPITVYPAPCAHAETGYIYWFNPQSRNGLTNEDVVWADSEKFLEQWKKSTERGGIPHVEPDLNAAKKYGSYILRTSYDQPFEMARVSYNRNKTSLFDRSHFLAFSNGRHRVANAMAFGCEAIPVSIEEIDGREKFRNKVGHKDYSKPRFL